MRTFYRVARTCPPGNDDYTTASERRGGAPPPPYVPPERHRSWYDGLSAYDTIAVARACAIRNRGKLGSWIVRYDIPEGRGITWELFPGDEEDGHYDLFGDREELKSYQDPGSCFKVEIPSR